MSIKSLIKANGAITIADFINEAMFNPINGYYRTKKPIGAQADFITAPEISSIFGELIAAYFLNFILASDKKIAFVEMGAGLGTLYFDILSTFEKIAKKIDKYSELQNRLSFSIVEISEELTKIQQEKLAKFNISWFNNYDDFLSQNKNQQIYFVANELFDCFAIQQFSKTNGNWQEILVGLKNEELYLFLENFNPQKHHLINKIALEDNIDVNKNDIIFEHSFFAINFMEKLSKSIKNNGGIGLVIDYGYYESALKNTLQALKNHQKTNILQDVGNSDLTALVNFKALEKCAKNNGLQTSLITQREFLTALHIEKRLENSVFDSESSKNKAKLAINRLIDKNAMGDLFKCLIFSNI